MNIQNIKSGSVTTGQSASKDDAPCKEYTAAINSIDILLNGDNKITPEVLLQQIYDEKNNSSHILRIRGGLTVSSGQYFPATFTLSGLKIYAYILAKARKTHGTGFAKVLRQQYTKPSMPSRRHTHDVIKTTDLPGKGLVSYNISELVKEYEKWCIKIINTELIGINSPKPEEIKKQSKKNTELNTKEMSIHGITYRPGWLKLRG